MGLDAEIEALRRQNGRLKVALYSSLAVFLLSVALVASITGIAAVRARAEAMRAMEREQLARAHAEAAFMQAQEALEQVEAKNENGS